MRAYLRLGRAAAACAVLGLLAGCWSSIELNNRAFISTMIVDRTDKGLELTLNIPLTSRLIPGQTGGTGGTNKQPVAFVTRTGATLEEALQKIQGDLPRKISFGQTHSIIVGSRLAEQGIAPILEFVSRNPYLRLNTSLFMVEGQAKEKVAKSPVVFERFFASVLNGYIRNHQVLNTTVKDLMYSSANGGDGLLPILRFDGKDASLPADTPPSVGTAGAAILLAGKVVKPRLNPDETSSARAILAQLKQYTYSVKSPTDGQEMGFYTTSLRTEIHPFRSGGRLGILIRSYSDAGIIGSDSTIDLSKQDNIRLLQREIKKFADSSTISVVEKIKTSEADVFNFARYVSVQYPKEWNRIRNDWRAYFKNDLDVRIDSIILLRRVGASTDSYRDKFLKGAAESKRGQER
ncbi:Ger(x)C family spore germination protein [Cohnella cellulosilytica]|uniref:Ger(X)C family spore germination protein n=1 Tax=Cohnella cellulosilytica TaxID=986710 RepID=A0ABW2FHY0_9BACL